ncbi:MAG: YqaA family protein [Gammaproteobacteria bacterium]
MRLFEGLYNRVMTWSRHPKAPWFLAGLSFAESSFFPIPPDVMLAPMSLARPSGWWRLAALTTLASVLGGLLGYAIGSLALETLEPWIRDAGYWEGYLRARTWFHKWGFWAVFVAGFSPIPYKVFTIAAGSLAMALLPFIVASTIGRGLRFFLVAGLMAWGGERLENLLGKYVEMLGWALVATGVVGYLVLRN